MTAPTRFASRPATGAGPRARGLGMEAIDARDDWRAATHEAAADWSWLMSLMRGWPA